MNLNIKFKNIQTGPRNIDPVIKVLFNDACIYNGIVKDLDVECNVSNANKLQIFFVNKTNCDTSVDNTGKISSDMCFELEEIFADSISFEDLLWSGKYYTDVTEIDGCLFFGPVGYYEINFEYPILKWKLKTKHDITGSDPNWEEDYNYYVQACKILDNR